MRAIAWPRLHPSTRDRSCFILTLCVRQTDFPLVLLLLCEAPASVSSSLKSALITCKHSHIRPPERRSSSSNESLRWPFKPHEVKPHTHIHTHVHTRTHTRLYLSCVSRCVLISLWSLRCHISNRLPPHQRPRGFQEGSGGGTVSAD